MGRGLLRSMIADQCVVADIIPVDLVVNMTITVVWFRATILIDKAPLQKMYDLKSSKNLGGETPCLISSQQEQKDSTVSDSEYYSNNTEDNRLRYQPMSMSDYVFGEQSKHHNNNNSVYHLTTGGVNPFTWGEMGKLAFIL